LMLFENNFYLIALLDLASLLIRFHLHLLVLCGFCAFCSNY
jgi:hypothetical protein